MANEIKETVQLTYEKGQLKYTYQPGTAQLPQSTQGYENKTVTVNTSAEEDISLGLTTPGFAILESMEATTTGNWVKYGAKSTTGGIGNPLGKLYPKEKHIFHYFSSTAILRMQANTAAVNVQITAFEQ